MFQQVPMVEIDGMKLVQTRAILNYIATKYNLSGKDMKERAMYDAFTLENIYVLSWMNRTMAKDSWHNAWVFGHTHTDFT